jgi:hypothetical protein
MMMSFLSLDGIGVRVRGVVVACPSEGELEALAALPAVRCGDSREGESHVGAAADSEGYLADAGHGGTAAVADTAVIPVGIVGPAFIRALPRVFAVCVFFPGTVRFAAVPVACGPAAATATLGLYFWAACRALPPLLPRELLDAVFLELLEELAGFD